MGEGLATLLSLTNDIRVTCSARDGVEALDVLSRNTPAVLLLDIRMPRMDGLSLLRTMSRSLEPLPATIILTTFDDEEAVLEGLRLGARGYLLKDVSFEKLASAIRVVASGGTLISPAVTERLLRGFRKRHVSQVPPSVETLTPREHEVLCLMSGGFNNAEIASALNLTEGTIKNHVSNVLSKLSVRDRVRAILRGIEIGII